MIDLYTYTTPNGRKPAILLKEYDYLGVSLSNYLHLQRWVETLGNRSAVQRGMAVLSQ